ncbi:MAG: hypothetical protein ABL864_09035 [Terricaulis sp.]
MVFDWIKRKAQEVQDAAARSAYRSAFERLSGVAAAGYLLDFDAGQIPSNLSSIDLAHARGLGTADSLKARARNGELLRSGVEILRRDTLHCSAPASLRGAFFTAHTESIDSRIEGARTEDEKGRLGDAKTFLQSVFLSPDWFSRPIHGMSADEKAVLRAAHFWEARGLVDRYDAADLTPENPSTGN